MGMLMTQPRGPGPGPPRRIVQWLRGTGWLDRGARDGLEERHQEMGPSVLDIHLQGVPWGSCGQEVLRPQSKLEEGQGDGNCPSRLPASILSPLLHSSCLTAHLCGMVCPLLPRM